MKSKSGDGVKKLARARIVHDVAGNETAVFTNEKITPHLGESWVFFAGSPVVDCVGPKHVTIDEFMSPVFSQA